MKGFIRKFRKWTLPNKASFVGAVVGVLSLVLTVGSLTIPNQQEGTGKEESSSYRLKQEKSRIYTYDMYKSIKPGMSYEEIVEITNSEGIEVSADRIYAQYKWQNSDASAILVGFMEGKALTIQQLFLR